jgi:hypothetical protein
MSDSSTTPDTPDDPIQKMRDRQSKTMLTVLATLASIDGLTIKDSVWPHIDPDEDQQRFVGAVSFFLP